MMKVTIEFEAQYGREASTFFANLASAMGPTAVAVNVEAPVMTQVTETVKLAPETTKKSKKGEATKETTKVVKPSEAEAETAKEEPIPEVETTTDKEPDVTYTLVQVREKLTELSRAGKQARVKALIEKHGATKLSEIKEESYAALMKEAEVL